MGSELSQCTERKTEGTQDKGNKKIRKKRAETSDF